MNELDEAGMVAALRALGYRVYKPGPREGAGGRLSTARRREAGTLDAHMAKMRAARTQKNGPRLPEPAHGTPERYWRKTWACRCELCRAAMTAYYHKHPTKQRQEAREERIARARARVMCQNPGCERSFFRGIGRGAFYRRYCSDDCKADAKWKREKARRQQRGLQHSVQPSAL